MHFDICKKTHFLLVPIVGHECGASGLLALSAMAENFAKSLIFDLILDSLAKAWASMDCHRRRLFSRKAQLLLIRSDRAS